MFRAPRILIALTLTVASPGTMGLALPETACARDDGRQESELEKVAGEIQADMAQIAKEQSAFLEDPWLMVGATYFASAQLAARELVLNGKPNPPGVNDFHNALDEFLRAVDALQPEGGWGAVKGTKKPSGAATKKVRSAVVQVKAKANKVEGLRDLAHLVLGEATTPGQVAFYGEEVIRKIEGVLYGRGLRQITGAGRADTDKVIGSSFRELRAALSKLAVDESGVDGDGAPLEKRITNIKTRISKLREDLKLLEIKLPWVKVDHRTDVVTEDLNRLEQNLGRLKSR